MSTLPTQSLEQASIYNDLNSLDSIRRQGLTDEVGAIKKAAKEFEAFFMNMMLKSMRQASETIAEDSPFNSQQEKMFVSMLDEQLSVELSQQSHFGIADMMTTQLARQTNQANTNVSHQKLQQVGSSLFKHARKEISVNAALLNVSEKKEVSVVEQKKLDNQLDSRLMKVKSNDLLATMSTVENKVKVIKNDHDFLKPEKKSVFNNVKDFISTLLPYAKKAAQKLSLDPKILIAQAALETGWGKFVMHDHKGEPGHNLFGIKAGNSWQGEKINIDTLEVENQQFKKVNAAFRKYQNFAESFEDYVNFVSHNPRYQKALQATSNASDYLNELQSSGYATDPKYAEKILRILKEQKLMNSKEVTQ